MLGLTDSLPAVDPTASVTLTDYRPNSLTYDIDSSRGGLVVLSEVWFPWGWKAQLDGVDIPVARANYILRAVNVPAGRHSLTMTFNPESISSTETVAKIAILLIYLWVIAAIGLTLRSAVLKSTL